MALDRRIKALEAKKAPYKGPDEIWWISPTTEEDLERGWQRAIRNFCDPQRKAWGSEEVRVDARIYSESDEIIPFAES